MGQAPINIYFLPVQSKPKGTVEYRLVKVDRSGLRSSCGCLHALIFDMMLLNCFGRILTA